MTIQSKLTDFLAELDTKLLDTNLDFYSTQNLIRIRSDVKQAIAQNNGTSTGGNADVVAKLDELISYIDGLELKADTINLNTDTLEQLIGASTTTITSVGSKIDATNTKLDAVSGRLDSANQNINTVNSNVVSLSTSIASTNTALGTVNSNITSTNTAIAATNTALGTTNSKLTGIDSKVANSNTLLVDVYNAIQAVQGGINTSIASTDNIVTYLSTDTQTDIEAVTTSIVSLESEVGASIALSNDIFNTLVVQEGATSSIDSTATLINTTLSTLNTTTAQSKVVLDALLVSTNNNATRLDDAVNRIAGLVNTLVTVVTNNSAVSITGVTTTRRYLLIQNTSTANMWIGFSAAVTNLNGILLPPNASIKFTAGDLYTGAVWAYKTSGTGTLILVQG
jgi:chromosome segregation ATPase